jgi:kinesin family protein 5
MQGKDNTNELGIIPRAANMIYHEITNNNINCEVKLSVLEIYKEKLSDLLSDNKNNNQNNLRIREHSGSSFGTSVWVEGLIETSISNVNEFMDTLNIAYKKRTTASHKMNEQSSRSHLIVVVSLKQVLSGGKKVLSKLHLIDLAGSEMVRKTDASGKRLDEAKHINKSLSALGKVIYALSSSTSSSSSGSSGDNNTTAINARAPAHIPYRDSKLTRLLQDSLGGNAKTVLLLAVSAASIHIQESIATLRFGERARQVCTRPIVNTELDESSLKSALATAKKTIITLNATITELQLQLLQSTTYSTNTSGVCQTCMSSLVSTASPTITKKTTAHTTPMNVIPTQYTS